MATQLLTCVDSFCFLTAPATTLSINGAYPHIVAKSTSSGYRNVGASFNSSSSASKAVRGPTKCAMLGPGRMAVVAGSRNVTNSCKPGSQLTAAASSAFKACSELKSVSCLQPVGIGPTFAGLCGLTLGLQC